MNFLFEEPFSFFVFFPFPISSRESTRPRKKEIQWRTSSYLSAPRICLRDRSRSRSPSLKGAKRGSLSSSVPVVQEINAMIFPRAVGTESTSNDKREERKGYEGGKKREGGNVGTRGELLPRIYREEGRAPV